MTSAFTEEGHEGLDSAGAKGGVWVCLLRFR